jgi:hypothetical protein
VVGGGRVMLDLFCCDWPRYGRGLVVNVVVK